MRIAKAYNSLTSLNTVALPLTHPTPKIPASCELLGEGVPTRSVGRAYMGWDPNLDTSPSNTSGLHRPCKQTNKQMPRIGVGPLINIQRSNLIIFWLNLTHGLGNVLSAHYTTGKGFGHNLCSVPLVCSWGTGKQCAHEHRLKCGRAQSS